MRLVEIDTPTETLSLEKAKELFLQGSNHSQGNINLFLGIFNYIHQIHPNWQIDSRFQAHLFDVVQPQIDRVLHPEKYNNAPEWAIRLFDRLMGQDIFDEKVERRIKHQIDQMRYELDGVSFFGLTDRTGLVPWLAEAIAVQDHMHLTGRHRQISGLVEANFNQRDMVGSYLCHYGLEENSTGMSELDRMYGEIKPYVLSVLAGHSSAVIVDVVSLHFTENPRVQYPNW